MIKRILWAFVMIVLVSLIGGYLYFDEKFSPPENYLELKGTAENIPFEWVFNERNSNVAILLPVRLEGIPQVFYMQLDFGSPMTVFYSSSLISIQSTFSNKIKVEKNSEVVSLKFNLGRMGIFSDNFQILNYGKELNLEKEAKNIIGTIGTDLLEKRLAIINFKENHCSFNSNEILDGSEEFEFTKRKILFPVRVKDKKFKMLYDSGTSGYELITDKDQWDKYRLRDSNIKVEEGNSWGNKLTVITAPAAEKIEIGNTVLDLSEVTYIEGTSAIQNLLMKLSGMQGMIGNKLFLNHKLVIDCKNEKFKIE